MCCPPRLYFYYRDSPFGQHMIHSITTILAGLMPMLTPLAHLPGAIASLKLLIAIDNTTILVQLLGLVQSDKVPEKAG